MSGDFGLTVRRFKRRELLLDALVAVVPSAPAGVRFSGESGHADGTFRASLVDLSEGGMGLKGPVFLPRKCGVRVRILDRKGQISSPLLEAELRVQRVTMADRTPTYLLGLAFVEASPALSERVAVVLKEHAAMAAGLDGPEGEEAGGC